jgi:CheY-like chemotaxis protein
LLIFSDFALSKFWGREILAWMVAEGASSVVPERRWRLLLCDDSPVERLALGHFLRLEGYDVNETAEGQSAIDYIRQRPIDLLILDLHMPGTDGFDVLTYLQQHRPELPVVLMSGMAADQIQDKMHILPKHFLPPLLIKPVDLDQVLDLVEMQLAGGFSPGDAET